MLQYFCIFLKFQLVHPGNQRFRKQYLRISYERTSVKIFTGSLSQETTLGCGFQPL